MLLNKGVNCIVLTMNPVIDECIVPSMCKSKFIVMTTNPYVKSNVIKYNAIINYLMIYLKMGNAKGKY